MPPPTADSKSYNICFFSLFLLYYRSMGEIPLPISDFIIEARKTIPNRTKQLLPTGEYVIDSFPGDEDKIALAISKKYNMNFIGCGTQSIVIVHPKNDDLLYKIPWNDFDISPKKATEIYNLHKLIATVFPANIPQIHAAFGVEPNKLPKRYHPGFIVTRIRVQRDYNSWDDGYFPDLFSKSRDLGIPVDFDGGGMGDLVWGDDGNPYYLDQISIDRRNNAWLPNKLFHGMKNDQRYTTGDINTAKTCVRNLYSIGVIKI